MCQSADCQFTGDVDKENWDWNNNSSGGGGGPSQSMCPCLQNRRIRRRHPATIQTPGRMEVGEVVLEPLVSNRLEGDPSQSEGRTWNENFWKSSNNSFSNNFSNNSSYLHPNTSSFHNKPQRFEVLGENFRPSSGGGGGGGPGGSVGGSVGGGWKQNFSSSSKTT